MVIRQTIVSKLQLFVLFMQLKKMKIRVSRKAARSEARLPERNQT